jgi:hypothetical protein
MPGFEIALWNGLMAPAGRRAAITRIATAAAEALRGEGCAPSWPNRAASRLQRGPEEYRRLHPDRKSEWTEIVRLSGATAD